MIDSPEVGDYVQINGNALTWLVLQIETRIDPLGVVLESGVTGRRRRETYASLRLFKRGGEA